MLRLLTLNPVNGQQVVPIGGVGQLEIVLNASVAPTGGALKVEGQPFGTSGWRTIQNASVVNLASLAAGPINLTDFGHYTALRFTIAGITGSPSPIQGAANYVNNIADDIFNGFRAMNVQSYVESNVKLGTQFYVQVALPPIDHLTTYAASFTTGALPVLVKDRQVYGAGNLFSYQVFKAPVGVTGGVAVPIQNFNDVNPNTSLCTLKAGVTVTGNGTSWGDAQRVYGSGSATNRVGQGLVPSGDRVLKTNSTYLVVFSNLDTTTGVPGQANIDYFLSWYEGNPDLPRQ